MSSLILSCDGIMLERPLTKRADVLWVHESNDMSQATMEVTSGYMVEIKTYRLPKYRLSYRFSTSEVGTLSSGAPKSCGERKRKG